MSLNNVPLNNQDVTFSAGSAVFMGLTTQDFSALPRIGLLTNNIEASNTLTKRQARGGFPNQVMKQSALQRDLAVNFGVQELSQAALLTFYGLELSDLVSIAGGDQAVVAQALSFNSNGVAVIPNPVKAATTPVVKSVGGATTYVAGTDYIIMTDIEGRSLVVKLSGGGIGATAEVDYTYVAQSTDIYDIGCKSALPERKLKIVDYLENGGRKELYIYRASVEPNGNLTLNSDAAENGITIPLTAIPMYDTTAQKVMQAYYVKP